MVVSSQSHHEHTYRFRSGAHTDVLGWSHKRMAGRLRCRVVAKRVGHGRRAALSLVARQQSREALFQLQPPKNHIHVSNNIIITLQHTHRVSWSFLDFQRAARRALGVWLGQHFQHIDHVSHVGP